MTDILVRFGLPFALALLIWAVRRYGPAVKRRLPTVLLPWIAAALGGLVTFALRRFGVELPELRGELGAAIEGVLGVGLAASGAWSLTAAARKWTKPPA